jgi:NAD(P)-dependent dehydrogenase (short-subunit alcohol dehydrogenase family)
MENTMVATFSGEEKIALVTNGCQFAGSAALLGLQHLNCRVYVHDQSFADNAQRDQFASAHHGVTPLAGNRLSVAGEVMKAEGRLDILIENASIRGEPHATDDDDQDALTTWLSDAVHELVVEPFKLVNFAARAMRQRSQGVIVLITSETRDKPQHGSVFYSAMRAAFPTLALGAARDLAPAGIQVNCVSPNYLESREYYPPELWSQPEKKKELAEIVPVGRLNTAGELGNLIGFLASGPTAFLTGSTIKIDGGALV